MVAQISVVVDKVMPNGDLHVEGAQALKINGEKTNIHVSGTVRLADITSGNAVLSSSLADAIIDYDGAGFVSASSEPGLITRALNWLDLAMSAMRIFFCAVLVALCGAERCARRCRATCG